MSAPQPRVGALVVAAGSGTRLGADAPKAFVTVGGQPLVVHAVRRLLLAGVGALAVAAPASHIDQARELLTPFAAEAGATLAVVPGGAHRQASVAAALAALGPAEIVLVHDAARCLAPPALVARVVEAVRAGAPAVIPVVPVVDTLVAAGDTGLVGAYEDRSRLRAVQTPQGFDRATLEAAHAGPAPDEESAAATDDASLVAATGVPVQAVPGDDAAMKITTPRDLVLAEALLAGGLR